ncbi:hypothetical protein SDC9_146678 [bioreactor metagenome]|uniref:Uncharacterized protein n=1 Tax=bioreactor metagenome TaxID=1076179 RepID=A0A645EBY7_9ZZZZ
MRIRRKDKRTDIKRGADIVRNPVAVDLYERFNGVENIIRIHLRNAEAFVCVVHSFYIFLRPEKLNLSFFGFICLQTFKHFLAIMKDHCGGIKRNVLIRNDSCVVPALSLGVVP